VLSTANIGKKLVNPAIQASSNGALVAVASRDVDRARGFAAETGIPRHHDSYEALLDDPDVDAVYIPLPNGMHREWSMRAAEHGKHVLCEKPLALDAAECLEMDAAAKDNGVLLMEAFMYRFHPRIDRLVELVRSGAVGELRGIRSAFTFRLTRPDDIRWSRALGGGALMDVGCYCVNVSRTVTGAEPVEVAAWADWTRDDVDARLAGMLRFENGGVAQFDCALTMERREMCEVAGTAGVLTVEDAFLPGTGDTVIRTLRGRAQPAVETIAGADEYCLMIEHFADCALTGAPLRYPAAEAAANMRVVEALYRSARAGGAVQSVMPSPSSRREISRA
jgi:D-xylose 1-dehydrogenase (NADP+, D-xylono-1,5-lactone-forming)